MSSTIYGNGFLKKRTRVVELNEMHKLVLNFHNNLPVYLLFSPTSILCHKKNIFFESYYVFSYVAVKAPYFTPTTFVAYASGIHKL